jgi:hypothetical protein
MAIEEAGELVQLGVDIDAKADEESTPLLCGMIQADGGDPAAGAVLAANKEAKECSRSGDGARGGL